MNAEQFQLLKDVGTASAIIGFQIYNVLVHRQNKQRIVAVTATYDDVKDDIEAAHMAIERIQIRLVGGDRRAARAPAPADPTSGAAQNLSRRWGDSPNYTGTQAPPSASEQT